MKPHVFFIILCTAQVLETKKFKLKLISVGKCDILKDKLDKSEPVVYETAIRELNRHTSVIKTNFTVHRAVGPVMMNFRVYQVQPTSRQLVFKLERHDCRSPFTYQLVRVLHLELDNDCIAQPGSYSADNINLQDFAWILTKGMVSPSKYAYELEFYTNKGIAVCNAVICDISEKK